MSSRNDESKNIIKGTNGMYKLEGKKILGKGSFSIVYLGVNILTYEKVAIKKYLYNRKNNHDSIVSLKI